MKIEKIKENDPLTAGHIKGKELYYRIIARVSCKFLHDTLQSL
jgi:hypothetical protein